MNRSSFPQGIMASSRELMQEFAGGGEVMGNVIAPMPPSRNMTLPPAYARSPGETLLAETVPTMPQVEGPRTRFGPLAGDPLVDPRFGPNLGEELLPADTEDRDPATSLLGKILSGVGAEDAADTADAASDLFWKRSKKKQDATEDAAEDAAEDAVPPNPELAAAQKKIAALTTQLDSLMTDEGEDPVDLTGGLEERTEAYLKVFQKIFREDDKGAAQERAMQFAMIGFAIAAGQSPNALTNIAQGLLGGSQAMMSSAANRRAESRDLKMMALKTALGYGEDKDDDDKMMGKMRNDYVRIYNNAMSVLDEDINTEALSGERKQALATKQTLDTIRRLYHGEKMLATFIGGMALNAQVPIAGQQQQSDIDKQADALAADLLDNPS